MTENLHFAEIHQNSLRQYADKIAELASNPNKDNFKKIFSISEEIQNVIHCYYDAEFYLPPLEVSSEDFRENPKEWINKSSERTVRVIRNIKKSDEKAVLSIGSGGALGDQSSWCPVCEGTPKSRRREESD